MRRYRESLHREREIRPVHREPRESGAQRSAKERLSTASKITMRSTCGRRKPSVFKMANSRVRSRISHREAVAHSHENDAKRYVTQPSAELDDARHAGDCRSNEGTLGRRLRRRSRTRKQCVNPLCDRSGRADQTPSPAAMSSCPFGSWQIAGSPDPPGSRFPDCYPEREKSPAR